MIKKKKLRRKDQQQHSYFDLVFEMKQLNIILYILNRVYLYVFAIIMNILHIFYDFILKRNTIRIKWNKIIY